MQQDLGVSRSEDSVLNSGKLDDCFVEEEEEYASVLCVCLLTLTESVMTGLDGFVSLDWVKDSSIQMISSS